MKGGTATGFGFFPFGHAPFGTVNWSKEVFTLVPNEIQIEDDAEGGYLQLFVDSISPSFNDLLDKASKFPDLADPDNIPIELLPFLAETYSIELEQILSNRAQRGFVRNAVQWMALKGTEQGYKIRGNVSGFDVQVAPLYRLSSSVPSLVGIGAEFEIPPGSGKLYTNIAPSLPLYDETPADIVATDTYEFEYGGSPPPGVIFHEVLDCDWCRSHKVRLVITEEDLDIQAGVSVSEALQSIVSKLDDIKPAHVEIVQVIWEIELNIGVRVRVEVED